MDCVNSMSPFAILTLPFSVNSIMEKGGGRGRRRGRDRIQILGILLRGSFFFLLIVFLLGYKRA